MDKHNNNKQAIDFSGAGAIQDSDTGAEFQNKERPAVRIFPPGTPKIIQWVIKYSGGLIKNEKQASYVIFGVVALIVIVVIAILVSGGPNQPTPGTIPADQFVPS